MPALRLIGPTGTMTEALTVALPPMLKFPRTSSHFDIHG